MLSAKQHSVDVERLISSYNQLKTPERSTMSPETLHAYLFIRQNMPPLAQWNPRPAVKHWINFKDWRPKQNPKKAKDQDYFKEIFF